MDRMFIEELALADNRSVLLPSVSTQDTPAALLKFFHSLPPVYAFHYGTDLRNSAAADAFIADHSRNLLWSVAAHSVGGRIVALGSLFTPYSGWRRYVGEVRLAVVRDFRHHGIGTALLKAILNRAHLLRLRTLQALVLDNEPAAHDLLTSHGFEQAVILMSYAMDSNEIAHDVALLISNVNHFEN